MILEGRIKVSTCHVPHRRRCLGGRLRCFLEPRITHKYQLRPPYTFQLSCAPLLQTTKLCRIFTNTYRGNLNNNNVTKINYQLLKKPSSAPRSPPTHRLNHELAVNRGRYGWNRFRLCSAHCYPDEEKTKEATKQTFMDKGMNPSAREARRVSPANAVNSFS